MPAHVAEMAPVSLYCNLFIRCSPGPAYLQGPAGDKPYALYIYLFNLPLYRVCFTYPIPLYTYLFIYPYTPIIYILNLPLYLPLYLYDYLPLYLFIYALYFVIGLPLLCIRYTYPYTYIYTYLFVYLFTYLAATRIFCRLLTPIYTNWAPLLCSSGMPYIFTYICTYILYIITSLFVNK